MALPSVTIKVDIGVAGHAFLTLDDGNGNIITRGFYPDNGLPVGPGEVRDDADYEHTGLEHPYDWSKTIPVSQEQYDAMKLYIEQVDSSTQDQYGLLGNNCAEFVKDVLAAGNVNYPHNGIHPVSSTMHPAIALLMEIGNFIGDLLKPLDNTVYAFYIAAQKFRLVFDPLTLDLDGDGLETTGIDPNAPILFDHNADGIKTGTGWVKADDGMLVLDRNGNGSIDSGRELFGDSTVKSNGQLALDGFDALADLDSNGDGKISSADAQFTGLRVWRDLNQDGISQGGELFTLDSLNIASINVAKTANSQTLANENQIADLGTYTRTDGSTGTSGDMSGRVAAQQRGTHRPTPCGCNLAADTFHREFTDTLDTSTVSALPDMQGSGVLRDLRQAASQSATLQNLLAEYSATTREAMNDGDWRVVA